MSSSLTFQLRQQQQDEGKQLITVSLPSPPNSSYGDEASAAAADSGSTAREQERRDSLPTHFNALTLEHFSTSLPENYTIEHSSSPIAIHARKQQQQQQHHPRAESPSTFHHLSPTATAAATGGRTIRNTHRAKSIEVTTSSLPNFHSFRKGNKQLHRCEDCGKVYKHPSCLSKHRWEHSDEWELTSKLLLTKHQQVQMLEAAAILVSLDTRRIEEEKAREQDQSGDKQRKLLDDDDDGSIHIDDDDDNDDDNNNNNNDDDDDDDESLVDNMEMDDDESISIASSTASSPGLLPASFPHGD